MRPWPLAAVLAMALVLLAVSGKAQTKIGPTVGLRLPVYDLSCPLDPSPLCYRYLKLNVAQSEITPDPTGLSDGIWGVKLIAAPGTSQVYEFAAGFVTITPEDSNRTQVHVDTAYMLHLYRPGDPPPVVDSDCYEAGSGATRITQSGVYFCVGPEPRRPDNTGWQWKRLAWSPEPPPVVGANCGQSGLWSLVAGMYVCSDKATTQVTWVTVPMQ